jgi:hypothetical protein
MQRTLSRADRWSVFGISCLCLDRGTGWAPESVELASRQRSWILPYPLPPSVHHYSNLRIVDSNELT